MRGPPSPLLRAQVVTPPPLAEPACMSRCSPRWALGAARQARRPDFHRCRRCSKQIGRMRAPAGHLGQPRWSRVGKQLVFCYLFNLCMTARLPVAARTQVWPRGGVSLWREAQRTCTLCSASLPLAEARLQVRRPPSPPPSRASRDPPPPSCRARERGTPAAQGGVERGSGASRPHRGATGPWSEGAWQAGRTGG